MASPLSKENMVEVNVRWATTTYRSKELKKIQISNKILKVPISLVIKEIQTNCIICLL